MFNLFTPFGANKVLPEIRTKFSNILNQRIEIMELETELNYLTGNNNKHETFFKLKKQINRSITSLYKQIEELEELGVMIKSFDEGLIDFPAVRYDEEVWLCWKLGEDEVRFWHRKDEGFTCRKPLSIKGTFEVDNLEDLR
ncbi:MAG: DUF2203 domain-containing protein [Candidatus Nitrosocosmicus sp.]|jgi:hypothetical protein|uniref:DUF2203 domain-containing protein n=1 Tax=Candidatus Nitrosocosmicus agrestis TaxID=2563600 RepID=UPI00122DE42C|nr:DUF2203 domain-containing protein [Candidatus Nitrosocosmicus sp. SS]KAA2282665.1 DUF2203 family protein [Candidatus Nitrosocosmicus sp. SS]KAF0867922.1 DUF2203 family protein [Candidatus Nitrosocosmicus sp. SS]MDR4491091.1 DUF2203 domain-containing protein [Candidatus Nitrosocosmicus sp.]